MISLYNLSAIVVVLLLTTNSYCSQAVDCIKFQASTYARAQTCQSTTSSDRPINATARIKATTNITWYGADDFDMWLINPITKRQRWLGDISSCFQDQPPKKTLKTNEVFEVSVKCVLLPLTLEKGDLVEFSLFVSTQHKKDMLQFYVPIPGFSDESLIRQRGLRKEEVVIE